MPQTIDELLEVFNLEQIEPNLFRGLSPHTDRQRVFGGQVLGQSLWAASRSVSTDRPAHSLHAYFVHPGRTDMPIVYDVDDVKDGRAFTSRRVLARQNGRVIFMMTCSFQIVEDGLDHGDAMPADVPAPEDCPPMEAYLSSATGEAREFYQREWGALELRFAGDSSPRGTIANGNHSGHMRGWCRVRETLPDDPALHQAALAYASDLGLLAASIVPHGVSFDPRELQAASLDHSMWFHRPIKADQWMLLDEISPSASNARGFSIARVFQNGQLVCSAAQEGLIRPVNPGANQPSQ